MKLIDNCGRVIDYLRVSVTDRCNLRCLYCMPEHGVAPKRHEDVLRFEEILRIVRVAKGLGIDRVRLTGGEPLVRKGIVGLVRQLGALKLRDLAMTTNGVLLEELAKPLREAGLGRVNISLDTLDRERYRQIARSDCFDRAWRGIEAAIAAGLSPVKINMVPMRGFNDDEIERFAELTLKLPVSVRFIELMPVGYAIPWSQRYQVSAEEVHQRLFVWSGGDLEPERVPGAGPAKVYRSDGAPGTVGLISPLSEHICTGCNRLRLTADGRLIPCLASSREISLRDILRRGGDDADIEQAIRQAVADKPSGGGFDDRAHSERMMSHTGG